MIYSELLKQSPADVRVLLAEQRSALRDLIFQVASGRLKNVRAIRLAKRTIAQIQTRLSVPDAQDNKA